MCVCGLGLADLVSNEVKATRRSAGRGGRTVRYHMIEYAEKFFGECWMRGGFGEPGRGMGWEWDGKECAMRAPVGSKIISGPVYGHMFQKTRPVGPACRT